MDYKELATYDCKNHKKINAMYAGIVSKTVSRLNFPEAPYFEILYFDNEDKEWHCGFGSYTFAFVEAWLKSEFEPTYKRIEIAIKDLLDRADAAEAHCKRLDEYRENANEAAAKWEGMYYMAESRAEKAERERGAAVKYIRHYGWCAGCKYFRGVRGCAGPGLKNCTEQNDYYEFGQKEE